jgi:3-hydroxyacyl-[acyl-carrier-protein] dehydratase
VKFFQRYEFIPQLMLINDFFKIIKQDFSDNQLNTHVVLQPDHPIFEGHFPGFPVVPGVVQLQIVKEILQYYFDKEIRLSGLNTCKFLQVINPQENTDLYFEISLNIQEVIHVNVIGRTEGGVFMKAYLDYINLHL